MYLYMYVSIATTRQVESDISIPVQKFLVHNRHAWKVVILIVNNRGGDIGQLLIINSSGTSHQISYLNPSFIPAIMTKSVMNRAKNVQNYHVT